MEKMVTISGNDRLYANVLIASVIISSKNNHSSLWRPRPRGLGGGEGRPLLRNTGAAKPYKLHMVSTLA